MKDDQDKLLKQFFDINKQEIADDGFSKKVMHKLPLKESLLLKVWTVCCVMLALVLFFILDGFRTVLHVLGTTFISLLEYSIEQFDLKTVVITGVVILFLGVSRIAAAE